MANDITKYIVYYILAKKIAVKREERNIKQERESGLDKKVDRRKRSLNLLNFNLYSYRFKIYYISLNLFLISLVFIHYLKW